MNEKTNKKPEFTKNRLKADDRFENREAFAQWLEKELEVLELAFADFATVNSFRSFVGR